MAMNFIDLRRKMVDSQIRTVDVTNFAVLEAFSTVAREDFVSDSLKKIAYLDEDIMLKAQSDGQFARYMMAPASLAKLIQLADIRDSDSVLDIAAGSGYCASLLSLLASSVVALESDKELYERAVTIFSEKNHDNVSVVHAPLLNGHNAQSPYDVIIVEGAVEIIPDDIFGQLKEGGRFVFVEGYGNSGVAKLYTKEDGLVSGRRVFNLAVKPLQDFQKVSNFTF